MVRGKGGQCFSKQNPVGLLSPAGYEDSITSGGERKSLGPLIKGYCPFPHSDLWHKPFVAADDHPTPSQGQREAGWKIILFYLRTTYYTIFFSLELWDGVLSRLGAV